MIQMNKLIKLSRIFAGSYAVWSFIDFAFARTMYGGMCLSNYNVAVVLYRTLDNLLQGFIF